MTSKILVIDDDEKLNRLLKRYLADYGFDVQSVTLPAEGLKKLQIAAPDLVILDVMLPAMNGFEVCKKIRQFSSVPVIMLTARGEVTDRVVGLELGADDYLPKPFEPRELVARIQSILRRSRHTGEERVQSFGHLRVDFGGQRAWLDGETLNLTTNEFTALALLIRNAGRVMDRDALLQALRGMDSEAFNRSVDVTLSRLRQKLQDDPKNPAFIKTVWGSGYVFIAKEDENAPKAP